MLNCILDFVWYQFTQYNVAFFQLTDIILANQRYLPLV